MVWLGIAWLRPNVSLPSQAAIFLTIPVSHLDRSLFNGPGYEYDGAITLFGLCLLMFV